MTVHFCSYSYSNRFTQFGYSSTVQKIPDTSIFWQKNWITGYKSIICTYCLYCGILVVVLPLFELALKVLMTNINGETSYYLRSANILVTFHLLQSWKKLKVYHIELWNQCWQGEQVYDWQFIIGK